GLQGKKVFGVLVRLVTDALHFRLLQVVVEYAGATEEKVLGAGADKERHPLERFRRDDTPAASQGRNASETLGVAAGRRDDLGSSHRVADKEDRFRIDGIQVGDLVKDPVAKAVAS